MFFDSLSGLWFGLSLPAIVLLYLFKRKFVDTPISSHLLWNRALKDMEANRPWQKLRTRLLMLVQLLAAALLVLAIMQPWIWSHRSAKAHVVVVLDRSASMTAAAAAADGGAAGSRLDRAKEQIADWADNEAKNSAITLLTMGEQAEVPLARETDRGRLREALRQVEPSYGKTAYKEAMSLAAALTRDDLEAEVRLFTDGQIAEPVTGLSFAVPVTVRRVDADGASGGNAGITQFGVKSAGSSGGPVSAVAAVRNWGVVPAQVEASLYAGSERIGAQAVTVEPGKQTTVYFEQLRPADWYRLEIGPADSFPADNVSYAFLEGARPRNVLLIGEGNLFLEKALRLAGAEVTQLAPENAAAWIGSQKPDSGPDLIAVDSVPADVLASSEWSAMLASCPVWYIRAGYAGGDIQVPPGPYTVEEHPVTRYLKFQDTHVVVGSQTAAPAWGKPIVSAKELPLVYAGTENGQPRLLMTFALQQSDLPLRSEFPVFVQNALGWLTAAQGGSLGRAVAGERMDIAMTPSAATAVWVKADETGQPAAAAERQSGRLSSVQTVPEQPGLYRLEEKDEAGQTVRMRWLGVAADARESGGGPGVPDFGGMGLTAGTDGAAGSGTAGQTEAAGENGERSGAPFALWRWIAALVLAAVVWEWGVYRRGTSV